MRNNRFMKRISLMIVISIFPQIAFSDCDIWTISIQNAVTHESREFTFLLGENKLDLPEMKDYSCSFSLKKNENESKTAFLSCDHYKGKELISYSASGATCYGSSIESANLAISEQKNGKTRGYLIFAVPVLKYDKNQMEDQQPVISHVVSSSPPKESVGHKVLRGAALLLKGMSDARMPGIKCISTQDGDTVTTRCN